MRRPLFALTLAAAVVAGVACSSTSPTPKPALTVDCQPPPITTGTPGLTCAGVCVAPLVQCGDSDAASDVTCPTGMVDEGLGACQSGAHCCVHPDGGADSGTGAEGGPVDASGQG